ncbi:ferredoxin [Mycobacterium aquaticum]|uniref:Ferredoxin n=1 Tax=Mycobacterium aquaticum TaxID=1927124 RepID=A0A1X0A886_9MYCO|nr:ferredoxin [Mycobacterium aquaticum]ORA26277.1 hypothetical protein BST13_31945 [Mycobacterium aquaticum]
MRITVDFDRCEGHGLCEQAAEAVFQLDDDGNLVHHYDGKDVPEELQARAIDAVFACPVAALSIEQPTAERAVSPGSDANEL